jgi:CRISPR-associated protein Cas5h
MIKKLLIFDIEGKFACFKKFYTNSSALTYEIPTRTNLIGLLASILKLERDSYYEKFNSKNCKISISLKTEIRKKINTVNHIKKAGERANTPKKIEILSPKNLREKIIYRIYFYINNEEIFKSLVEKIKNNNEGYGTYLGQKQFRANLNFIDCIDIFNENYKENENEISTILNENNVNKKDIELHKNLRYETFPIDFNEKRELIKSSKIFYKIDTENLKLNNTKFFKKVLKINYKNNVSENICFFEDDF